MAKGTINCIPHYALITEVAAVGSAVFCREGHGVDQQRALALISATKC